MPAETLAMALVVNGPDGFHIPQFRTFQGIVRTSGWVRSALPMGEVRALPGDAGRKITYSLSKAISS